jgi:hypothetical protein
VFQTVNLQIAQRVRQGIDGLVVPEAELRFNWVGQGQDEEARPGRRDADAEDR